MKGFQLDAEKQAKKINREPGSYPLTQRKIIRQKKIETTETDNKETTTSVKEDEEVTIVDVQPGTSGVLGPENQQKN